MFSFCPDPERAQRNIEAFLTENPGYAEKLKSALEQSALLFSHSQFLANYCIYHPESLFHALEAMGAPFDYEVLCKELRLSFQSCSTLAEGMKAVRLFKKEKLLITTLKDILKKAEFQELVLDLSTLADAILEESLTFVDTHLRQRFGVPVDNALAVMGLGKLGAQELNYSSDVDIIFVYRDEGETSGVPTVQGVTMNRISVFEYYTKLVEEYTKFLSSNTGDGFAYRVDLRLRPQGQRGSLALSLRGYEEYYESWGQIWERAALLRTRTVAGDQTLGNEFLKMVAPFVYRKYLGFDAIDEIRRMKSQVEQIKPVTLSRDIKRGYGGIREIEFFIQIFQLLYGGREPLLRERSTLKSLYMLLQKGFIGHDDYRYLADNYVFLRTLEHRLQQLNDIQTHALPSGDGELAVLARKMGFNDRESFLSVLDARRRMVRTIYDSLLEVKSRGAEKSVVSSEGLLSDIFWDMETPAEHLLSGELSKAGIKDTRKAVHYLTKIRNTIHSFQTLRGRRRLEEVIPLFVEAALKSPDPDTALLQLVDFSSLIATNESYLEAITGRGEIIDTLTFVFSHSEYLSKIFMSNPQYIGSLFEGDVRKKRLAQRERELRVLADQYGESAAIRLFRRLEEIRLGILFLNKDMSVIELMRNLSSDAELVMALLLKGQERGSSAGLGMAGFGKLGGREITFNSDLDLIFISLDEPEETHVRAAEKLLRISTSYTKDGIAYKVDTRLRPEGSKGPLISSMKGLTDYYLNHAQAWELQALLKARPLSGDKYIARRFMEMREAVLVQRGGEVTAGDIRRMRERISRELSKDSVSTGTYDIKLGKGGLEELEFLVQYLQLRHCRTHPRLLVQGTLPALHRLGTARVMGPGDAAQLGEIYLFFRTIETVLRLRNETVLKKESASLRSIAGILDMSEQDFLGALEAEREWVSAFWNKIVVSEA
ncbi:MAG: bifunctional [glutamate--ammonia ligase]-adenylyl-L-tyrosine phosphorylase/[glutamate--ammonia-ligase] adenylyltransferase [Nitrospirota bacterium]